MITAMRAGQMDWMDSTGAAVDNLHAVISTVHGSELGFCEPYRFGNLKDPEEWFDPTSHMSVRLTIQQLLESGDHGGIVLQQKRIY